MNILLKNGTTVISDISTMPKISFEGGIMTINTDQIQVENIVKYTITDGNDTGIGQIENARADFSKVGQGLVTIINDDNQQIHLYDVNGMSLPFKVVRHGGTSTLDFSTASAGIYVLTIGNQPIKCRKQ